MALLEIADLSVRYGEIVALRGISLSVDEGRVVTLLGSNGAGKSTTLRAISGLAAASNGEIVFDGHSIRGLGPEEIVRKGIAHVPEGRRVFPGLSVRENIMLGASSRRESTARIRKEADDMFDLFPDIRPFADALGWMNFDLLGHSMGGAVALRLTLARPDLVRSLIMMDTNAWSFRPLDVDLRWVAALCYRNNVIEESGVAAAVLNHPGNGVAWLADRLARHDEGLEAGEIVLGGSFTRPVPCAAGDTFHADYGPLGSIALRFV